MLNQARNVMHATLGEFNDVGHDKKVLELMDNVMKKEGEVEQVLQDVSDTDDNCCRKTGF